MLVWIWPWAVLRQPCRFRRSLDYYNCNCGDFIEVKLMDDVVQFKSTPENWEKEASGVKPNTMRRFKEKDPREDALLNRSARTIRIINTESGQSFERSITDATFFDGAWIISWRHRPEFSPFGSFGVNRKGVSCISCGLNVMTFLRIRDGPIRCLPCTRRRFMYDIAVLRRDLELNQLNIQRMEKMMDELGLAEKVEGRVE